MDTETIYIQLLEEGTEVLRPAKAEIIKEMVYRVLEPEDYDPGDED